MQPAEEQGAAPAAEPQQQVQLLDPLVPKRQAVVFYMKKLTNWDQLAGIIVMQCTAILKHKAKGHFNLNT